MTADAGAQILVAVAGVVVFIALAFRRSVTYRQFALASAQRLVLVDLLLVVAAVEVLADTIADTSAFSPDVADLARAVSLVTRGALIAGGVALLVTLPGVVRGRRS